MSACGSDEASWQSYSVREPDTLLRMAPQGALVSNFLIITLTSLLSPNVAICLASRLKDG